MIFIRMRDLFFVYCRRRGGGGRYGDGGRRRNDSGGPDHSEFREPSPGGLFKIVIHHVMTFSECKEFGCKTGSLMGAEFDPIYLPHESLVHYHLPSICWSEK